VAEGVETEEQLTVLRKYRCQEIQGYLFSPPVLPKDFEPFLIKNEQIFSSYAVQAKPYIDGEDGVNTSMTIKALNDNSDISKNQEILHAALDRTKEIYSISAREMDVFNLLVNGLSNKEISEQLFISEHTVKNHITRIFQKLTVNDRLQAMAKIYQACIEEGKNINLLN
jgi:DNA-binding CsgD family transcriptional regulator